MLAHGFHPSKVTVTPPANDLVWPWRRFTVPICLSFLLAIWFWSRE